MLEPVVDQIATPCESFEGILLLSGRRGRARAVDAYETRVFDCISRW